MGRFPVAVTLKKKGLPGRTPNTLGPVIRGVARAFGVRISATVGAVALVAVVLFVDWENADVMESRRENRTMLESGCILMEKSLDRSTH